MMEFTFNGIVRQGFGFYNPNHAAAFFCAIFPFLWGWKRYAWIGWILTILLTIPLGMTFSRTGVLVLLFEFVVYFLLSKNNSWKLILSVLGGVLLVFCLSGIFGRFTLDKAVTNRPEIWVAGLKLYATNPLGVGVGNSGAIVSSLILDGICCRTLVNSHITLLVELGIFVGFSWLSVVFYSVIHGRKRIRLCTSFCGLVISGFSASIFDWGVLLDFQNYGYHSLLNFCLSWMLLVIFFSLSVCLMWGKFKGKELGVACILSMICVITPCVMLRGVSLYFNDDVIYTSNSAPLLLYDDDWSIKTAVAYSDGSYQIPVKPGFKNRESSSVFLFGNASEYAGEFPERDIVYVHPPEFFIPALNTKKIILQGGDDRANSLRSEIQNDVSVEIR